MEHSGKREGDLRHRSQPVFSLRTPRYAAAVQFASFDLEDPVFPVLGLQLSVQVVTLENLYGLAADHVEVREGAGSFELTAEHLAWAGQQERAHGYVELRVDRAPTGSLRAVVRAGAPNPSAV